MSLKKALGRSACLAAASAALLSSAPAALAGGTNTIPTYQDYIPVYVHNAAPGGYDENTCETTLFGLNMQATKLPNYTSESDSTCFKLPSGKYTYGSFGFSATAVPASTTIDPKKLQLSPAQLSTVGGATFQPIKSKVGNYIIHRSADYSSQAACETQEQNNVAALEKAGMTVVNEGPCSAKGADLWSYGSQAYTRPAGSSYLFFKNDATNAGSPYNSMLNLFNTDPTKI